LLMGWVDTRYFVSADGVDPINLLPTMYERWRRASLSHNAPVI
jgi:hypothetical protein